MSAPLTCPACRAEIESFVSEYRTSIRCPACGSEIPVPAAGPATGALKDDSGDGRSARSLDLSDFRRKGKERRAAKFDDAPPTPSSSPEPPREPRPVTPLPEGSARPEAVRNEPEPPRVAKPVAPPPPVAARVAPAAPVAAPVVARPPVAARAVSPIPPPRSGDGDELPARGRFRHRTGPRADDELEPRRSGKTGGGQTLLIVLGAVAVVAMLAIAGIAYGVYRYLDTDETVETALPSTGPGPSRPPPTPTRPNWEKTRFPLLQANGFTVQVPVGAGGGPRQVTLDGERVSGHRYEVDEACVKYRIEWYDLPAELPLSAGAFVRRLREQQAPPATLRGGPTRVTIGGQDGEELVYQGSTGQRETVRAVKIGPRVLIFSAAYEPAQVASFPGLVPEEKLRAYFDSVRLTFDPKTPPPPSRAKSKGPRPNPPPAPRPGRPRPPSGSPSAAGGITPLTRIDPYTTAVYLPERKELLTFGSPRGGPPFTPGPPATRGRGVVRRYSVPDFKLLATRELPRPVLHAAADEKGGRLYGVAVNFGPFDFDAREQLRATGDVEAYDLAEVLSGDGADGPLRPKASYRLNARFTDLELSPDGSELYTASVVHRAPGTKPQAKLLRLKTADLSVAGELELAVPVLTARLSPDGKHLMALEHPFNEFGVPGFNRASTGNVLVVDSAGMKPVGSASVGGLPSDLRFVDGQRAVAVVLAGIKPRLFLVTTGGEATDVTAPEGLKAPQAGFLAVAPAAGRMVSSARLPGMTGTEVFEVRPGAGAPRPLASASVMPNTLFAGPVVLTPDGKYAVYATGTVLDLSRVGETTAGD